MRISFIRPADVLVSTDGHGSGYYRVIKVNRTTIDVMTEQGCCIRVYPEIFDRVVSPENVKQLHAEGVNI